MNDDQHPDDVRPDARLDEAIRSVLGDVTAAAPRAGMPPAQTDPVVHPIGWRRPLTAVAASVLVVAGAIGLIVTRDRDPSRSDADPIATTDPLHSIEDPRHSSDVPGSVADVAPYLPDPLATTGDLTPITTPGVAAGEQPSSTAGEGPCGTSEIPQAADVTQTIEGDIDGDAVDDTVSLYYVDDEMFVYATSSVKGWASTTPVTLEHGDRMMETISFEDVDYSLGAERPPPRAVMVTGVGDRIDGAWANFTFLSNTTQYCIRQWTYRRPIDDVVEPFEWVALREPGHLTGMICEGAAGSRYYTLVDSEQNDDGSWTVITRLLTHDFTRAKIEFQPEQTLPDSADVATRYGDIVGCDHAPIGDEA